MSPRENNSRNSQMSFSTSLAAGAAANQWNLNCPGSINYPYLRKKSVHALPMLITAGGHRQSMFDGYRCPVPVICQPSNKSQAGDRNSSQNRLPPQDRPKRHVILTTEKNQIKMNILEQQMLDVIGDAKKKSGHNYNGNVHSIKCSMQDEEKESKDLNGRDRSRHDGTQLSKNAINGTSSEVYKNTTERIINFNNDESNKFSSLHHYNQIHSNQNDHHHHHHHLNEHHESADENSANHVMTKQTIKSGNKNRPQIKGLCCSLLILATFISYIDGSMLNI